MKNYFLSYLAEQDADEIVTDIARENPASALKFLDVLYETMDLLATHPQRGHKREDLTQKPVRFLLLNGTI
jgi:plasmid stabilization system protein ParE